MELIAKIAQTDPDLADKLFALYQEMQWAGMGGKS